MRELVGECAVCGKEVFCLDGFLNGVVDEEKKLLCFECTDEKKNSDVQKKV
ncbi:hypothetical protein [Bacillus piscicola]|uniref:hypothetical protein n=1 Tax=Bacillus piscicola TaxID=1632684 RepID=UPI001F090E9D|nr:hypothetical protein [Bacillus piscicola]